MLLRTLSLIVAVGSLLLSFPAAAQFRPFVEFEAGRSQVGDVDFSSPQLDAILPDRLSIDASSKSAWVYGGEAGVVLTEGLPGLRASLSASRRKADFDDVTARYGAVSVTDRAVGNARYTVGLVTLGYEVPIGAFRPYAGVGLGRAWTKVSTPADALPVVNDSASSRALAAFVGAAYDVSESIYVGGKFRHLRIRGTELDASGDFGAPIGVQRGTIKTDDIRVNEFVLTVGYRF